ncbi:MAG: hypothetical protein E4G95_09630, partial [Bacteroidia bacterium]
MFKLLASFTLLINFLSSSGIEPSQTSIHQKTIFSSKEISTVQDTLLLNQILYNGRIWTGTYYGVVGTQFMIGPDWLNGDVTMNGTRFNNLPLKYDIYNDELLINYLNKWVLILNREMVDS